MKKMNQKGFSIVEVIIVIVVLGLIAGLGYYIKNRHDSKKTSTPPKSATPSAAKPTPAPAPTPAATPATTYLEIKEWGVKIKMADADKVTYTYAKLSGENDRYSGTSDSDIALKVKPSYLKDPTCDPSVGIMRVTGVTDTFFIQRAKKIGQYYYIGDGSPYACEDASDNALNNVLRSEFSTDNLVSE